MQVRRERVRRHGSRIRLSAGILRPELLVGGGSDRRVQALRYGEGGAYPRDHPGGDD